MLKLLIFWSHLFRPTFQFDKKCKLEILSKEFHFAIHQFVERKVTIEVFILNAGRLNMRSNFDDILIIVVK